MNRLPALLGLLLLLSGLASGSGLLLFRTQALPGGVQLEWAATNAPGVISYGIDRQDGPTDDFDHLTSLTAGSQSRYSYFDRHTRPIAGAGGTVTYRLTVHSPPRAPAYLSSPPPPPNHPLNSCWSLIKQMFR
ncbi:hypothetical protein [Hymenobacter lapidiphilus]|uniref:hypothetical protein n=1 Tax=Hymenobacter sp. CCM 8763 TaxID=2303334 RepID=UPI0011C167EA|nr:hypothetical protein [Hymenobacter sp. CCM 8763]